MQLIADFFTSLPSADIDDRRSQIRQHVLRSSRYIQSPNFVRAHDSDLRTLFDAYDVMFFGGTIVVELKRIAAHPISLVLTGRLRSSGGRTKRITDRRSRKVSYEIHISSALLFDNFKTPEESAEVVGLDCRDRLDAMMRVMEHEMLHLAEFLAFGDSKCSAKRFQTAAANHFGHKTHKHAMPTSRTRTLASTTLRPGHRVSFTIDGSRHIGIINRINRRATVLVEHRSGQRYTDGRRYLKYYVPVGAVTPIAK